MSAKGRSGMAPQSRVRLSRGIGFNIANGAPRSMKMGTIASPWSYDAEARHALQSANLRPTAILHYDSSAAVLPISQGGPVTPDSGPHHRSRDRRDGPLPDLWVDLLRCTTRRPSLQEITAENSRCPGCRTRAFLVWSHEATLTSKALRIRNSGSGVKDH
jgi:hypothetical protein